MNRHQLFAFLAVAAGQGAAYLGGSVWGHLLAIVATLGGVVANATKVSDVTGAIQRKLSAPDTEAPPTGA